MNLTNDDVQELLRLLDQVPLDEFEVTTDRFHVRLRRSGSDGWTQVRQVTAPPRPAVTVEAHATATTGAPDAPEREPVELEGRLAVRAPLLGTFYRAPRPGADPFVEVGDHVDEDTAVGIVETMKLMNSVPAGVVGTVVEILKGNAEFTEKDEILMVVEPDVP
ncbi:acetyl-CoA carboxylase biotin carboxyl carrier protein [Egicoccus sp. AB-alg2]|uniref:acetyl-CoA carboxylase biotin carboxyl carrier protein n=1 Tax=Egicoccus sp. AB-alg2 TaxID=3242693 RepID=UPI00359D984E